MDKSLGCCSGVQLCVPPRRRLVSGGVRGATSRGALMLAVYAVLFVATFGLFKAIPSGYVRHRTSSI